MQLVILVLTILRPNINKCKLWHNNNIYTRSRCPALQSNQISRHLPYWHNVTFPEIPGSRQLAPRHAKQVAVVIQWFNVNIIIDHCLLLITWWLKKYEPLDEYRSVSFRREVFSIFRKSQTPTVWQGMHKFNGTRIHFDTQVRLESVLEFNHVKS